MDGIKPAQLSFLTIYNPSLGATEETSYDQIIYFYSSRTGRARQARQSAGLGPEQLQNEERNERMRQVGLAQGIVNLAREFADESPADYVDTEKDRIFVHEIEQDWWLLASIDLTQIASPAVAGKSSAGKAEPETKIEYSTRELSPQPLLLQHVLRAHGVFLLHHGASLSDIMSRRGRLALTTILERFWNRFVRHWDVLMHGSPAVDIFNGLKLAAGGELGMGVGEEEWGSGERDVLEDLVGRTDGLVDIVVSRFGDPPSRKVQNYEEQPRPWLGTGSFPRESDGVILSGVGAVPRIDIIRVSAWMESIYRFGLAAYGIQDNPQSARRKRRGNARPGNAEMKRPSENSNHSREDVGSSVPTPVKGIPPPLVRPGALRSVAVDDGVPDANEEPQGYIDTNTVMKYMTLGIYGSSWGVSSGRPNLTAPTPTDPMRQKSTVNKRSSLANIDPVSLEEQAREEARRHPDVVRGCFLVGLQGDLNDVRDVEPPASEDEGRALLDTGTGSDASSQHALAARRIQLRSVHITQSSSVELSFLPSTSRVRVVIYAKQPFLYTFLFDAKLQPGLAFTSFYRGLHNQLAPLQKPLLRTTDPSGVQLRLMDAALGPATQAAISHPVAPVWDLVYDPANGTCHASLPGIPDIGESLGLVTSPSRRIAGASASPNPSPNRPPITQASALPWTRSDALAVHGLIVRIWQETRRRPKEMERTVRTARGWWVVWMRLSPNTATLESAEKANDEAIRAKVSRVMQGEDRGDEGERVEARERARDEARDHDGGIETERRVPSRSSSGTSTVTVNNLTAASKRQKDPETEEWRRQEQPVGMLREAFLIRRAPDKPAARGSESSPGSSKGFFSGLVGAASKKEGEDDASAGGDTARLVEGIGIDTRRYIEGLMSLNR